MIKAFMARLVPLLFALPLVTLVPGDAPVVPTDQHGATLVGLSIGHLGSNLDALGVHPGQPGATLGGLATGSDVVGNGQN